MTETIYKDGVWLSLFIMSWQIDQSTFVVMTLFVLVYNFGIWLMSTHHKQTHVTCITLGLEKQKYFQILHQQANKMVQWNLNYEDPTYPDSR